MTDTPEQETLFGGLLYIWLPLGGKLSPKVTDEGKSSYF